MFDAVDCISMLEVRRRTIIRNPFAKLFSWVEGTKLARWETKALRLFNRRVISSPVDKAHYPAFRSMQDRIQVVPNGVGLEHFRFQQFEPQRNLLVFLQSWITSRMRMLHCTFFAFDLAASPGTTTGPIAAYRRKQASAGKSGDWTVTTMFTL